MISEELNQPPPDPTIRFRLRTILSATTILAVAAAIAAPYWRRQPESVQGALLAYWGGFLAFALLAGWINWRSAWRHLPETGPISFVVWLRGRTRLNLSHHPAGLAFLAAIFLASLAAQSHVIASHEYRMPTSSLYFPVIQGLCQGFMVGGFLLIFLRRPVYLCENGISGAVYSPWEYIRHAEWEKERDGVLKLHRLGGDIYLDVPNSVRGEAEAFVRGKTRFVEEAALPPV